MIDRLKEIFFPCPFRFSWPIPVSVFLFTFLLAQATLVFGLKTTIPDAKTSATIAMLIAHLGAFFAPFAFLLACARREAPLSLRPLVSVLMNYVLPVTAIQFMYAAFGGQPTAALVHGLYLVGLVFAVWGIETFLQVLGVVYDIRRIIVLLLLVIVVCDVVLFNTVVERAGESRTKIINLLLTVNPVMVTASAYGHDILRGPVLYNRSVIGPYYYYLYPSPVFVTFILLIFTLIIGIASAIILILEGKSLRRSPPEEKATEQNAP